MKELHRSWLVKRTAKRANFTIGNVNLIWNTFIEILHELVQERAYELKEHPELDFIDVIRIANLFNLRIVRVRSKSHWNLSTKSKDEVAEHFQLNFRPSDSLRNIVNTVLHYEENIDENNLQDGGSE
jgi:hypothetical protein